MKDSTKNIMQRYLQTYSFFNDIEAELWKVLEILVKAFGRGGKLLLCGNGGSNADADHIVGELVKGFKKKDLCRRHRLRRSISGETGKMI